MENTLTLEEFYRGAAEKQRLFPEWRRGQTLFNYLYSLRPDLSERIRGNLDLDPFYKGDDQLGPFMEWLQENWGSGIPQE